MPLQNMRGQIYDGEANMSGVYNGANSLILENNELCHYTQCCAHRIHLIAEDVAHNEHIESTRSMVNYIGSLFSRSITFRNMLLSEVDTLKFKSMTIKMDC